MDSEEWEALRSRRRRHERWQRGNGGDSGEEIRQIIRMGSVAKQAKNGSSDCLRRHRGGFAQRGATLITVGKCSSCGKR